MLPIKYKINVAGIFFFLLLTSLFAQAQTTPKVAAKPANSDCLSCHADNAPIIDEKIFNSSIHQSLECVDCHTDITDLPHADKLKKVDCSGCHQAATKTYLTSVHGLNFKKGTHTNVAECQDCHGTHDIKKATDRTSKMYWVNIPKTCGQCHQKEFAAYSRGIHGQELAAGSRDTPVCTDCHGEHNNEAVNQASSKVSAINIPQTCGQCHSAQRINVKYSLSSNVLGSYMQSYHGLALEQGTVTAANCASCHGAHDILPSSDPRSMINSKNLEKTCGQCHPGMSSQVSHGSIHGSFKVGNNPANDWVRNFYIFLIFFVSGILCLHNLMDFSKKAMVYYRESMIKGKDIMGINERWQHFILALTFILLAYSGFSLKFPQTWWSFMFYGHGDWLRWGHRGTALVFSALAFYHVYYLFFTKKGRWQLGALSFKKKDFIQFFQAFQYYSGWRKHKPHVDGVYSYIQKLEYWALMWGSLVMILTGALMFSESWFLHLFPKWLYDIIRTVHGYEAILACITIIIWHGYFVIFDPDIYPGNWSWLNGHHPAKRTPGK